MLSNGGWMIAFGSAIFIVNDIHDTKNGSRKDKPSDKDNNNGSGDSHDYLFIPRMASEPLKDFFHIFKLITTYRFLQESLCLKWETPFFGPNIMIFYIISSLSQVVF